MVQAAFADGGHPLSRLAIYPEAGHGIRLPGGTWAPGHVETMTTWLQATLAGEATDVMAHDPAAIETGPNQWYGLAAATTPWYATAALQLSLILFFVLASLAALVAGLSPKTGLKLAGYGRWPRLALIAAGLVNIVLIAGVLNIIGYLAFADANNAGPDIPLAGPLTILAWISLPLAAGLIFFAAQGRRQGQWSRVVSGIYNLIGVTAVVLASFLAYWNVLALPL